MCSAAACPSIKPGSCLIKIPKEINTIVAMPAEISNKSTSGRVKVETSSRMFGVYTAAIGGHILLSRNSRLYTVLDRAVVTDSSIMMCTILPWI